MFALIDGNNFYAACERAFAPHLQGHPVVVLSNNDGCVISRSEEAKQLGIRMAQPLYQIQDLVRTHGVAVRSANFALYGDMSARMMRLAAALGPEQEIYSIDESFIGGLAGIPKLTQRAHAIRTRIERCLGIACCVGLGPTKTLAKLCNHWAKQAERGHNHLPVHWAQVCNWQDCSADEQTHALQCTPAADIWGIGSKLAQRLAAAQCHSAWDLQQLPAAQARRLGGVVLERTVRELQGIACIALENAPAAKQQIASTRSFGRAIENLEPLLEAVSTFACRAAEKARQSGQLAGQVHVFAYTSPFRHERPWHGAHTVPLHPPSNDSRVLAAAATQAARHLYQAGHQLSKAGVILLDLQACTQARTHDWVDENIYAAAPRALMPAVDAINQRFGKHTLHVASCGLAQQDRAGWRMKQAMLSPLYTMRYEDLPVANA